MCLAVPMKIKTIDGGIAVTEFAGAEYRARVDLVDAEVGDYILVHAGIAISKVDEAEALETIELLKELHEINQSISQSGDYGSPENGDRT